MSQMIRMSYTDMHQAADEFKNRSVEVEQLLSSLERQLEELFTTWEGAAEATFMAEWASCKNKLKDTPSMLAEIGRALEVTARTIRDAEEKAKQQTQATIVSDNRR